MAEGVGSSTNDLVFPGENDPRWMDLTIAFFTIPRTSADDRMWRWHNATGGRGVSLRPDNHGTTRAMLMMQQKPGGEQDWNTDRQKAHLRHRFAGVGWETARVLNAMQTADDFYVDVLRQVRMKRRSKGRVALLGDAAWCATPLAGIGTTMAVTGARVLAGELARTDDVALAFDAYERAMRPMVDRSHRIPKIFPRLMNPSSRLGIQLLHTALRFASRPTIRKLSATMSTRSVGEPDLSPYAGL